jgi:carboxymethylenebutenolidase
MDWLKAQQFSTGKAGVIGTCSGGRHAVIYCAKTDKADACLDLWGGRVVMADEDLNEKLPQAPIDMTADLNCPVLGLFGNDDQAPSPEQVDQHEEELKKHGKDYEFHRYDDAGHGFFYYNRPLHRVEQCNDGWEKIFAFMKKHVG